MIRCRSTVISVQDACLGKVDQLGGASVENAEKRACTILLVTRNGMGHAETSLQQKLFAKYLRLLDENNMLPGGICFYTEGVKLVTEGSPVLDQLRSFE
jgi:hypothetical protein